VDDGGDTTQRNFSSNDLKNDLFVLTDKTCCETYDVLAGNGLVSKNASGRVPIEQLHSTRHGGYRCTRPGSDGELATGGVGGDAGTQDPCLADSVRASAPAVSFVM